MARRVSDSSTASCPGDIYCQSYPNIPNRRVEMDTGAIFLEVDSCLAPFRVWIAASHFGESPRTRVIWSFEQPDWMFLDRILGFSAILFLGHGLSVTAILELFMA